MPTLRTFIVSTLAIALLSAAFVAAGQLNPGPADYTVHEWGTFTSVSGSDGVRLPGLEEEEEYLPPFVHSLEGMGDVGGKGWARPLHNVTVKLETPVLYFYSQQALQARIDVGFNGGSISQWYPPRSDGETAPAATLDGGTIAGGDIDFAQRREGRIGWDIDVVAPGDYPAARVLNGDETPSWIYPRQTDSNLVRTDDGTYEKYLFYRGVGNFDVPVRFTATADDRLTIENQLPDPIPFLLVFENLGEDPETYDAPIVDPNLDGSDASGGLGEGITRPVAPRVRARFTVLSGVDGGASTAVALDDHATTTEWQEPVYMALKAALEQAGLFPKEADAMIQTWWTSYFRRSGLRVFWIVPRPMTDEVLPLTIDPEPATLVRVLVGRSEVLTPAFEAELRTEFAKPEDENRYTWGRFGEAYKARVETMSR